MEAKTLSWEKLFERIGLTKYEAKIYNALAIGGPSEARKLSMTSDVPRTKIYGTLKKLIERGLITEIPCKPRKFAATSPAEAFSTFLQSLKNDLSERVTSLVESENAISFLEEIHKKRQLIRPFESQMGDVWFVQGLSETLHRIGEMLAKAKKSVEILTTENGLILFHTTFNKSLDRLVENDARIRINTPIKSSNKRLVHELRYAYEVKNMNAKIPILFICIDNSELLLAKLNPGDLDKELGEDFGFFSQNRTLCTFFSSLFGFTPK